MQAGTCFMLEPALVNIGKASLLYYFFHTFYIFFFEKFQTQLRIKYIRNEPGQALNFLPLSPCLAYLLIEPNFKAQVQPKASRATPGRALG